MKISRKEAVLLTFLGLVVVCVAWPPFTGRHGSPKTSCLSSLKQLGTAMRIYAAANDERLAGAPEWNETLFPYLKTDAHFHCPTVLADEGPKSFGYAMSADVSHAKLARFTAAELATHPLFFDSKDLSPSAFGDLSLLPSAGRHEGANNIAYIDGHAKFVRP